MSAGELVPRELVARLVRQAMGDATRTGRGLVLDGFPRDLEQMEQGQQEVSVRDRSESIGNKV